MNTGFKYFISTMLLSVSFTANANELNIKSIDETLDNNYPVFVSDCSIQTNSGHLFLIINSDFGYLIEFREAGFYGKLQIIFDDGNLIYDWGVTPELELRESVESLLKETFTIEQNEITAPQTLCADKNK